MMYDRKVRYSDFLVCIIQHNKGITINSYEIMILINIVLCIFQTFLFEPKIRTTQNLLLSIDIFLFYVPALIFDK